MNHRFWLKIVLALGLLDTIYLTIVHFSPRALYCPNVSSVVNCEQVLTSGLSNVFGIPLAVLGLVWFVVAIVILHYKPHRIVKNLWLIVGAGGIVYSITGQSILGKICIYCSALDVLIALSIIMFLYIKDHK